MPASDVRSASESTTVIAPLFSIVIPTLNRAYCLRRAVDSALAQTESRIELVVSNNASSDATRQLLEEYSDPRLRVFHQASTLEAVSHIRAAINLVSGPLTLILCDDDWLEPAFVARVLEFSSQHPEIALIHARTKAWAGGRPRLSRIHRPVSEGWELLKSFYSGVGGPFFCATVFRTAALRDLYLDIPDGSLVGDMFLWPRLAASGRVGFVNEHLANYFCYSSNGSVATPIEEILEGLRASRAAWLDTAKRAGMPNAIMDRLVRLAEVHETRLLLRQVGFHYLAGQGRRVTLMEAFRHLDTFHLRIGLDLLALFLAVSLPRAVASRARSLVWRLLAARDLFLSRTGRRVPSVAEVHH